MTLLSMVQNAKELVSQVISQDKTYRHDNMTKAKCRIVVNPYWKSINQRCNYWYVAIDHANTERPFPWLPRSDAPIVRRN